MIPQIKTRLFVVLLLVVSSYSGRAEGFKDGAKLPYPISPDIIQMMARKLVGVDAMIDYEPPASNGAHTPPEGGGGGSSKDTGGKRKGGSINN